MILDTMVFEFSPLKGKRSLASCPQINRRIVAIRDYLGKDSAHLEAGRILASRTIIAFDGFIDSFQSADFERHLAGKFFKHVFEMLKIAADEQLRLFGCDV